MNERIARGFVGKLERVDACHVIIIVNDRGIDQAAPIESVEPAKPMAGQTRDRVTVKFGKPRNLFPREKEACAAIRWTSNNVRYLSLP